MLSTILLTGLTLIGATVACLACYAAVRAFEKAESYADGFAKDVRSMALLRQEVLAIDSRLNRITGRVYAVSRHERKTAAVEDEDEPASAQREINGLDGDLAAQIALQSAPAASPGR